MSLAIRYRSFDLLKGLSLEHYHLERSTRMGRNFYKGLQGDAINVMLAAAAYNFKRAMRAIWCLFENWIWGIIKTADEKIENSYRLKFGF